MSEESEEKESKKYRSLSATTYVENLESASIALKDLIEEPENKNIAITGSYGAGKSSFIKSFFTREKDENVLYVSLGSYITKKYYNQNNDDGVDKQSASEIDKIETSILQQILYCAEPHKLPFSRIRRIDKNLNYIKTNCSLISTIIIFFICLFIGIKNQESFYNLFNESLIYYVLLGIGLIGMLLLVGIVLYQIAFLLSNMSFNKITINGVEVSKEESGISVLNRNIDELIHFFKTTEYNKVVFEDIDRFSDCGVVFAKLKEINMILNNALNNSINKKIIFIYAVGDVIFDNAEERTKFFDGVVPVVPYSGVISTHDFFDNPICKKHSFDDDLLNVICRYVDNSRVADDIINEYEIYYSVYEKLNPKKSQTIRPDKNALLVLCSYKIIYPKKFELLIRNKGRLAFYLSYEFHDYLKEKTNEKYQEQIDELNKTKELYERYNMHFNESIIDYLIYYINQKLNISFKDYNIVKKNNSELICSLKALKNPTNMQNKIEEIINNEVKFNANNYSLSEKEAITFCTKEDFFRILSSQVIYKGLDGVKKEISFLNQKMKEFNIHNIDTTNIIQLLKEMNLSNDFRDSNKELFKEDTYNLNSFEEWIIRSKVLNSNFRNLIVMNHGYVISSQDTEIIQMIQNNKEIEYGRSIKDVDAVLRRLSSSDFEYDSICIRDLFKRIVYVSINNNQKYKNHLNQFFLHFTEKKLNFLLYLQDDKINVFSVIQNYFETIIDFIENQKEITENDVKYRDLILQVVHNMKNPTNKISNFIVNYFKSTNDIEIIFTNNQKKLNENLKKYPLVFEQNNFNSDSKYSPFYQYLLDNDIYTLHYPLLKGILKCLIKKFSETHILESVFNPYFDEDFSNYYKKHIHEIILMIQNTNILQKDKEDFLNKIIKEINMSDEDFELLMKIEDIRIKDITLFGHYSLLKKMKKIEYNFNNLNAIYEQNDDTIDEFIIEVVNNNLDDLLKEPVNYNDYKNLFNSLYQSSEINIDIYKKLADNTIIKTHHYFTWQDNLDSERNIYLIENNAMWTKGDFDEIIKVLDRTDVDDFHKIKYLENSFSFYKDLYYERMTTDYLHYFVQTKVNSQELVNFIFKYENHFDKFIYNNLYKICITSKVNLPAEKIFNIVIQEDLTINDRINFILYYKEYLEDYIKDLIPYLGEDIKVLLINDSNAKVIPNTKEYLSLIEYLDSMGIYFDHYKTIGRKIQIYFRPKRTYKKRAK